MHSHKHTQTKVDIFGQFAISWQLLTVCFFYISFLMLHMYAHIVCRRWFVDFYVFAIIYHSILFKIVWLFCPSQKCTLLVYILDILFGRRGGYTYSKLSSPSFTRLTLICAYYEINFAQQTLFFL